MSHYFVDLNPIAISLGPVQVRWYGIMYVIGIAVAWWLGNRRRAAGRLPVSADEFSDLAEAPGRWLVMQKPIPVPSLIAAIDWLSGRRADRPSLD